ncbi:hypothetical protein B0J18DRAFT_219772 [Chaetomium sp. MPI-SDFR-AT-0129]|nr:hypothetical protein B0J18DRAFT_219772 [Chaetomium sp. MPI-SDFR-AT-0129]
MAVVPSSAAEHGHAVPDYPPKTQDCPQDPEKTVTPEDVTEEESGPPSPPVEQLQRWNESPINRFRYLTTNYCFALMGMTDGSLGALLPYVRVSTNLLSRPSCLQLA